MAIVSRPDRRNNDNERSELNEFTGRIWLERIVLAVHFRWDMNPNADKKEVGGKAQEVLRPVRFEALRRRTPSRDLVLVRWAAWAVIAAAIALVIFIIWGLATHEPRPPLLGSDPF